MLPLLQEQGACDRLMEDLISCGSFRVLWILDGKLACGESDNANACFDRRSNEEMEYMSSRFYWAWKDLLF